MKKFTFLGKFIILFVLLAVINTSYSQNSPIGCNGQFYVSHGPTSGSTGNTLLEKLTFAGLTITASPFTLDDGAPGTMGFNAMGLNPIDGYIYAIRYPASGADAHLVKIGSGGTNEIDLGAIAALNNDEISYAACFDADGSFYFLTQSDRFFKIANPVTSLTATLITTNASYSTFYDIAINPLDGQMYATSSSTNSNYLFTINKTTGALSSGVGPNMGGAGFFAGLFFDEVGNLFGYRSDGPFYLINKTTGVLSAAGSAVAYSGADGCSCSFGRVFHDLDFTANAGNQICPTQGNPNPTFPMVVSVTNMTASQQTGLTYTLNMVDPLKRFRFTESAATIKTNLIAAGVATAGSTVTLSAELPATGTNYNKVVVTGFQTGASASTLNFTLQVQLYSLGGSYNPVPLQSEITGLVAPFGPNDLSNDPTSITADDATVITFCPNITLPVKLLSFTGTYKNNATSLNWTAENQTNFAFYEIERSENGTDYSSITIKAAQQSGAARVQYQYTDDLTTATGNVFYYRLKMVDIDGQFKYSNIILVRKGQKAINGISISPNPLISGDMATVRFEAAAKATVDFKVVDIAGRVVLTQQNNAIEGTNSVAINNLDRLQPGLYVLQMNDGTAVQTTKFTIARK